MDAALQPLVRPSGGAGGEPVIAVSEFTKRELVELLGTPPGKVTVIPNGVAGVFSPDGPTAEGDYVLAVGTLEPRKNLERVQEAARMAGVELRVVGARGWGGVQAARLARPGLRRRARASLPGGEVPRRMRRCTKASACRSPRPWPAARLS